MIAAVSPCSSSSDHTVNTLRYADRVKEKHVSADAFEDATGATDAAAAVDLSDVRFETGALLWLLRTVCEREVEGRLMIDWSVAWRADGEESAVSPTWSHGNGLDGHYDDEHDELDGGPEEINDDDYDDDGEHELREAHRYRSDSASSQDIKLLHHSLRKQSRTLLSS